ncbi:MAG: hypothetical protein WKG07_39110 [Hymenobacter sp.]
MRRDEPVRPLLRMMHDAVERFQKTIGHLTDISKLQQARCAASRVPWPWPHRLSTCASTRLPRAGGVGRRPPGRGRGPFALPSSPSRHKSLRSILYNLLSNAIKHADPRAAAGGAAALRAHPPGHGVLLRRGALHGEEK